MAWLRQYADEIDAEDAKILRHWAGDRDVPAPINSDITISDSELIFCTGGSHTVVMVDLATLSHHRVIDEQAGVLEGLSRSRESATTVIDTLTRANVFSNSNLYAGSLRISRGALIDGIYATQLSADQSPLFTANRGQNHITLYDDPTLELRHRIVMPELQEVDPGVGALSDPRLGFHHSSFVSPATPRARSTGGDS